MSLRKSGAALGLSIGLLAACASETDPTATESKLHVHMLAEAQTFESTDYSAVNETIVVLSDMAKAAVIADRPDLFRKSANTECDFTRTFEEVDNPVEVSLDVDGATVDVQVTQDGYTFLQPAALMGRLIFEGYSREVDLLPNEFDSSVYVTPKQNYIEVTHDLSEPLDDAPVPSFGIRYLAPSADTHSGYKYFSLSSGYFFQEGDGNDDLQYGLTTITGDCRTSNQ